MSQFLMSRCPVPRCLVVLRGSAGLELSGRGDRRPEIRLSGPQESGAHNPGVKKREPQLDVEPEQPPGRGVLRFLGLRHTRK